MTKILDKIQELGFIPSDKFTSEQFLQGAKCFEMIHNEYEIYISYVDFFSGDNLKHKDLWSVYMVNNKTRYKGKFHISSEFIKDYDRETMLKLFIDKFND